MALPGTATASTETPTRPKHPMNPFADGRGRTGGGGSVPAGLQGQFAGDDKCSRSVFGEGNENAKGNSGPMGGHFSTSVWGEKCKKSDEAKRFFIV